MSRARTFVVEEVTSCSFTLTDDEISELRARYIEDGELTPDASDADVAERYYLEQGMHTSSEVDERDVFEEDDE